MKEERLLESELSSAGGYANLNIDITKQNLSEFKDSVIYHKRYIPESLSITPEPPKSIVYLSIDLNSVKATLSTLEFFSLALSEEALFSLMITVRKDIQIQKNGR